MKSSENVNPKWVLSLSTLFAEIVEKMFTSNSSFLFERIQVFLDEFKKITYVRTSEASFLMKNGASSYNELFKQIFQENFLLSETSMPMYLDGRELIASETLVGFSRIPMNQKDFFVVWYALTVDPFLQITGMKLRLEPGKRYHLVFTVGGGKFTNSIYVILENINNKWRSVAYDYYPVEPEDGNNIYLYLVKK